MTIQIKSNQIVAILVASVSALAIARFFLFPSSAERDGLGRNGPSVGEVLSVEGTAVWRQPRQIGAREVALVPGPLRAGTLIQTKAASGAVVEFRPGPTLRLLENTRLIAEVDASRPDAIQVTILSGEVAVMNPGSNSGFVLLQDGVPVDFSQGSLPRTVPLIQLNDETGALGRAARPVDLQEELRVDRETDLGSSPIIDIADTDSPVEPERERKSAVDASRSNVTRLFSTLTNDDIRAQIKAQAGGFQKCYVGMVNRLSGKATDAGSSETIAALPRGEVKVAFKIKPSGAVLEPRIVVSPFQDRTFDLCIVEALGRITFRSFQGATIPIAEFPILLE